MSDSETKLSESTGGPEPQGVTAVQKGIAVGLLLLLGAGWLFLHNRPTPAPTEAPIEERASIPPNRPVESDISPAEPNQENSTTNTQLNQNETQDSGVKVTERAEGPSDGTTIPSFDVVTINPDGQAVFAGRAEPGATVRIRVNGKQLARRLLTQMENGSSYPKTVLLTGCKKLISCPQLPQEKKLTLQRSWWQSFLKKLH